jgi:hypothetical protein
MMGCTTGAKVLRPGREFVLFKNRDFTREHYDDRLLLTDTSFGALGLETWDASDSDGDRLSGFSVGFNARLACCDSNVRTVPGGDNYDKLVQEVVENCTTLDQAIAHVRRLVKDQLFCWANMIVATPAEIAALEVREHHVEVERSPNFLARANHYIRLGATPHDDDTITTPFRYRAACEGLRTARRLEDIFPILRSHQPDPQHGICNHSQYNTVYSYAVHWNDGETTFYVLQGRPCEGGEYVRVPVIFGQKNDLSGYPSRYVLEQVSRNA